MYIPIKYPSLQAINVYKYNIILLYKFKKKLYFNLCSISEIQNDKFISKESCARKKEICFKI